MEDGRERPERRKSERIDAAFTLIYNVEKPYALSVSFGLADEKDALMVNLSDLGVAIITKHNIPVGTQLHIKFNIIDLHLTGEERIRRMDLIGETVSNTAIKDISHRIGIRFDKILEVDKAAIRDFLKRNKFPPDAAKGA
ncbi:MAG: PilZ domain-containing protein [Candidatus Omnitrophica bacterium]|nr:PilZ domain-containing protein [Candidatus Omnitrophota bacterium]